MIIERQIEQRIISKLVPNKVVILLGARRVGKTRLIKTILEKVSDAYLFLNGDDITTVQNLETKSTTHYKQIIGNAKLLVIDEAQEIPDIGAKLKLMVDTIDGLKILITGSSVFDLNNTLGEPLVGRKTTFHLYPFSQSEYSKNENFIETKSKLEERLIFGSYPELIHLENTTDKIDYLKEQINSYLLKDILAFEGIQKRDKIVTLLKLIAFRIGTELSLEGIGNELQLSKNTVEKYLDLFSKVFIIYKQIGFSRNLDNEITKKNKWYFMDNGIRNALIGNFNLINSRDDIGQLWENYLQSERSKMLGYTNIHHTAYFWRTHAKQEIDRIEEINSDLFAYEFKWKRNNRIKVPTTFQKAYPKASFKVIDSENYLEFIL
jgi:uncharacterized protein